MVLNLGLGLVRHAVPQSSRHTYEDHFGSWVWLRQRLNKDAFLHADVSPDAHSRELVEYIAFACMSKSLQAATIESNSLAIKHNHRMESGLELEAAHPLVVHALKRLSRCHVELGTQPRLRRPMSRPVLPAGWYWARWGQRGWILWLALRVACFLLMRASELFAEAATCVNEASCVRREDGAFFRSETQVEWPRWSSADTMKMKFRASKGDQPRGGTAVTRS